MSLGKWALGLIAVLIAGCSGNMTLDNPRAESVEFVIDGSQTHAVPGNSTELISVDPGSHTVRVIGQTGEVIADTSFNLREEGILHSGASTYVVWRQLYGLQKDRKALLNEQWVEFDSVRTFGDFKVYSPEWVFIEKSWDYGLEDPLPDAQTLYITSDFLLESKVFRAKDFVNTYRNMAKGE